ncbi:hypothetical protein F5Y14DRAFT_396769 [Nemania sp. NC0429]|nr:hypothetical protein F5Y14DRAFT_396769 [Nemania sp. NC0429]
MVDWSLVAVIIAILAYPLQAIAIPRLFKYIQRLCKWFYPVIQPSAGQCTALEWRLHFKSGPFYKGNDGQAKVFPVTDIVAAQKLWSGSWEQALSVFFPGPLETDIAARKVRKPVQLHAGTQYIRTDSELLLLYVYLITSCTTVGRSEFSHFVQLTEQNGILVAQTCLTHDVGHLGEREFKKVVENLGSDAAIQMMEAALDNVGVFGEKLTLSMVDRQSGNQKQKMEIRYPIGEREDWRRGGWIVALGMSRITSKYESPLLKPIIRKDMAQSFFHYREGGQAMLLPDYVNTALHRVARTLENLRRDFPNDRRLESAVDVTTRLYEELDQFLITKSILRMTLDQLPVFRGGPPFDIWRHGMMRKGSSDDCEFAVELFNTHKDLEVQDRQRLEPILADVCRAALLGMIRVFHFYKHGPVIIEPTLLKKYGYVYLEDNPQSFYLEKSGRSIKPRRV